MKTLIKLNCFLILIFCIQISFSQNKVPSDDVTVGLHKVEQGETLYSISKRFFLSISDVTEVNIGLTAENLKAGQIIKIPITVRNKELFNEKESQLTAVSNNTFPAKKKHTRKVDKSTKINIAVLLPLNYEEVDKLTFTKFNIDEKKRLKYKCFEYINFYEGMRIALDVLEKEGYIYRETVERDARLKKIIPTEKTIELHSHIISNVHYMESVLRQGIPAEDLEVCIRVLEQMSANLAGNENDRGKETTKHE